MTFRLEWILFFINISELAKLVSVLFKTVFLPAAACKLLCRCSLIANSTCSESRSRCYMAHVGLDDDPSKHARRPLLSRSIDSRYHDNNANSSSRSRGWRIGWAISWRDVPFTQLGARSETDEFLRTRSRLRTTVFRRISLFLVNFVKKRMPILRRYDLIKHTDRSTPV